MKIKTLLISSLLMSAGLNLSAAGYTVSGNISGHGGRILLLRPTSLEASDTLANIVTRDGSFSFTGKVDKPFEATVEAVGTQVRIPVFIEEGADIRVDAKTDSRLATVTGGGPLQQCRSRYDELLRDNAARRDSINNYYRSTYDMNDYFWVVQLKGALQREGERHEAAEDAFLAANDNMVSASIIAGRLKTLVRNKTLHKKYALLGPVALASDCGKMLKEQAELSSQISVGGIAPDFTMLTPDDKPITLHGIKGKVKILDFWASWCGPCRAETPNVKAIYDDFHSKGLEVISVSLDTSKAAWTKAIEKDGMNWHNASELDKGNTARDVYKVYGIPYMLILDENNRIISEGLRGEKLREFIASQFAD
ncbi:MAG: TlpA disulfide reductase family protein [Duncaniella sp.]|nr:TlpA disulfide reductase family protein [Duncaniella sp.]